VLSDSFDSTGGAVFGSANDDLPTVQVLFDSSGTDEGRAMLEIIHDCAPGAALGFATANGGEAVFASHITDLADPSIANCTIVADDIVYFAEPMFQDGIIAQAQIDAYNNWGTMFFSSAGNYFTSGFTFTNIVTVPVTAGSSPGGNNPGNYIAIDGVSDVRQTLTFTGGTISLALQWDDPFYTAAGTQSDIDVILLIPGTNTVVFFSAADNIANQQPVEIISGTFAGASLQLELMIWVFAGPVPNIIRYVVYSGLSELEGYTANSPTISPHSAALTTMSIGACYYSTPTTMEWFSSFGPSQYYFDRAGTRLTAVEI